MSAAGVPGVLVLLFDLTAGGALVLAALVPALRLAIAAPPRLRYGAAVLAFGVASGVPLAGACGWLSVGLGRGLGAAAASGATGSRVLADLGVVVLVGWACGALALVGRDLVGHVRAAFEVRRMAPAPAALWRALDGAAGPRLRVAARGGARTVGLLRPVVVLPCGLLASGRDDAVAAVARHEREHARWRDPAVHAVLRLVRAVLWPSLPLWLLERRVREEREAAADAAAIAGVSRAGRFEYAESLLAAAGAAARPRTAGVAIGLGGRRALERRLHRLLDAAHGPAGRRAWLAPAFLVLGCAAGGFGAAAVARPAWSPEPDRASWTMVDHLLGDNPEIVIVDRRIVTVRRGSDGRGAGEPPRAARDP